MPSRFTTHQTPKCTVGRTDADTRHARYDAKRRDDPRLGYAHKIRGSVAWKALRVRMLHKYPICDRLRRDRMPYAITDLELGCTTYSVDVHHVIPLVEAPGLGLMEANLRCLCTSCHSVVSRIERKDTTAAIRLFFTVEEEQALRLSGGSTRGGIG